MSVDAASHERSIDIGIQKYQGCSGLVVGTC